MKYLFLTACLLLCLPAFAAIIYVTEFQGAPPLSVYYQAVRAPALVEQTVGIDVSSAQSAAFGSNTGIIRVNTDSACHISIGTNPTATSSTMRMTAGQTEYFLVSPGQKLAVITVTDENGDPIDVE